MNSVPTVRNRVRLVITAVIVAVCLRSALSVVCRIRRALRLGEPVFEVLPFKSKDSVDDVAASQAGQTVHNCRDTEVEARTYT